MRRFALLLLIPICLAWPALGADFGITVSFSWMDPMGDVDETPSVDFDSELGFGVGANIFWSDRFSTDFTVHSAEPDVLVTQAIGETAIARNTFGINAILFTALAQYHFKPDHRWSPYVGAGAAYALFDDVNDPGDLDDLALGELDFDEDYGFAVNGGVDWNFSERWGVNFDVRYVPVETDANIVAPQGTVTRAGIGFSPLILSVGGTLRF